MLKNTLQIFSLSILFILSETSSAAIISGGSSILSQSDANQLESWLGSGPIGLTNIYTKSYGDTSYVWHGAVDNQGPTFTVIQLSNGNIIGGYNALSWASSGGYTFDTAGAANFLFNLSNNTKYQNGGVGSAGYYTFNRGDYGPTFGGGHDLYINSTLTSGYTNLGWAYQCGAGSYGSSTCRNQFAGSYNGWIITGLETFTITAVPLPPAAWLFGCGLLGLGAVKRRIV